MAAIEILTFHLAPDADEAAFVDADHVAQTEFVHRQPGLLRRTTARSASGEWLVVSLWASIADAEAAMKRAEQDPLMLRFMALLDGSTVVLKRYATLD